MYEKILILDRDQKSLLVLKRGLEALGVTYGVVIAGSILSALRKVEENSISIIITEYDEDLHEYKEFLNILLDSAPEIYVVLTITAKEHVNDIFENYPNVKKILTKPFPIQALHNTITSILSEQSEGGTLTSISLPPFLQLLEAEQKTCTLRIFDKSFRRGILFFRKGELVGAKSPFKKGIEAAKEILSWGEITISIENRCNYKGKSPLGSLRAIILESLRELDEVSATNSEIRDFHPEGRDELISAVLEKIEKIFLGKWEPVRIYKDFSWQDIVKGLSNTGQRHGLGRLRAFFVEWDDRKASVIVPLKDPVIMDVKSSCPRDKLLRGFLE